MTDNESLLKLRDKLQLRVLLSHDRLRRHEAEHKALLAELEAVRFRINNPLHIEDLC